MNLSAILPSLLAVLLLLPECSYGKYSSHIQASLERAGVRVDMEPFEKYEDMKKSNFKKLLDGQTTNANESTGEEEVDSAKEGAEQETDRIEENTVNLEGGGLRHSGSNRSREVEGRRTKRRLPASSGKKGLKGSDVLKGSKGSDGLKGSKGLNGLKGSTGKKGSSDGERKGSTGKKGSPDGEERCNICPDWAPITQLSSSGYNSGKKGYDSGKKGGDSDCGCGCDCDCGSGGGKKGSSSVLDLVEVKVGLNLTTTFINDEYTHDTPNLSYTYDGLLDFGGDLTGIVRVACTINDATCDGGMCTSEILVFDKKCGSGDFTFTGVITGTGYAYIDFNSTVQYPIDALMLASGRGLCGLEDIEAVEFDAETESIILTFTPATDPLSLVLFD